MDRWSVLVKPLEQTGPGKHSVPCAFGGYQLVPVRESPVAARHVAGAVM